MKSNKKVIDELTSELIIVDKLWGKEANSFVLKCITVGVKQELEKWNKFCQYLDITAKDDSYFKARMVKAINKRMKEVKS